MDAPADSNEVIAALGAVGGGAASPALDLPRRASPEAAAAADGAPPAVTDTSGDGGSAGAAAAAAAAIIDGALESIAAGAEGRPLARVAAVTAAAVAPPAGPGPAPTPPPARAPVTAAALTPLVTPLRLALLGGSTPLVPPPITFAACASEEWVADRPVMVPLGLWLLALWVDAPKSAMVLLSLTLTYALTNWSGVGQWSFTSLVCNVCLFHMLLLRVCSLVTRVATYLGMHVAEMSVPLLPPVPLVQHSTARALSDGVEALANGGILAWRSILVFKRPSLSLRVACGLASLSVLARLVSGATILYISAVACLVGPAIYVRNRTAIFAVGARVRAAVEHLFFALFVDKLPMSARTYVKESLGRAE